MRSQGYRLKSVVRLWYDAKSGYRLKSVLRLWYECEVSLQTEVCATIILLAAPGKGIVFGWIPLVLGELVAAYFLILGMRRLHRSLNLPNPQHLEMPSEQTKALSMQERAALPPQPVSIVEGTTELMTPQQTPLSVRPVRDTDSID
jgi:hypothetical protein